MTATGLFAQPFTFGRIAGAARGVVAGLRNIGGRVAQRVTRRRATQTAGRAGDT